jgi:hypothetical protein
MRNPTKIILRQERLTIKTPRETNLTGYLALAGSAAGVLAALLFACGQAYSNAYFREFGITDAIFETSWHLSLFNSSIHIAPLVWALVIASFAYSVFFLVIAWLVGLAKRIPPKFLPSTWISLSRLQVGGEHANRELMIHAIVLGLVSILVAGLYLIYTLLLIQMERTAIVRATNEMTIIKANDSVKIKAANLRKIRIEHLVDGSSKVDDGILIACETTTVCVIRQPAKTVVIPMKNVTRIESML